MNPTKQEIAAQVDKAREILEPCVGGNIPELRKHYEHLLESIATALATASASTGELRTRLSDVCFRYRQAAPSLGEATKHDHSKWTLLGELERAVAQAEAVNPIYDLNRAIPSVSQWQPIESAPRDGERIILANARHAYQGYWDCEVKSEGGQCWRLDDADMQRFDIVFDADPTFWQSLPAPPIQGEIE